MEERDASGLEILGTDECHRLLRYGGVGRLAWVDDGHPVIRPVNFALDDERIVIRTGEGAIRAAAAAGLAASFEADGTHNIDHTAWSVIVEGTIAAALDAGARDLPLRPWAPADKEHFVQVTIDRISGRRIGSAR